MTQLLTANDRARIKDEIAQVEAKTAGELVVAIVRRSAEYSAPRTAITFGCTLATAYVTGLLMHDHHPRWVLLMQVPVFLAMWWATGRPAFIRALVPAQTLDAATYGSAFRIFCQQGVHRTRDRSGLLILISETEHRVVILGDEGIHKQVGTEGWQTHVDAIIRGIRKKRAVEAIVEEVRALGAVLAEKFPPRPDDENELPDDVVVS